MKFEKIILSILFLTGCSNYSIKNVFSRHTLIDFTQSIEEGIPYYPGGKSVDIEVLKTIDKDGYYLRSLEITEHISTHIDAPSHFLKQGINVDEIQTKDFCGKGIILDISKSVDNNPDYALSTSDVERWEEKRGIIEREDIVLVHTGWSKRWESPEKYLNRGEDGKLHFPGVSKDAAELLIKGRKVKAIGIDTLSLDPGISKEFSAHRIVLGYGKYIIENLTNLKEAAGRELYVCVFPLKIKGGSGAPARVIGWMR